MTTQARRRLAFAGAVIVGLLAVVQSRINGQLGDELDDGLAAAWISFAVGLVAVALVVSCVPRMRASLRLLRPAITRRPDGTFLLKPWHVLGGIGGATYVTAQSTSVQFLGVAVFTVATVAAQNANSLVVDRIGLGPAGKQPLSAQRIAAAALATVGVAITVASRVDQGGIAFGALALALVAGALVAIQQAINGRVAVATGSPWVAGLMNFIVGWLGLTLAVAISQLINRHSFGAVPAPWTTPWLYLGGFIGVAFILVAAWVVPIIGVLIFALLTILGQMLGALLIDTFFALPGESVDLLLIVGVLITTGAIALATLRPRRRVTETS